MTYKKNILTFIATDFGAYCYHRFLHTFEQNVHNTHHENPYDHITMFKASTVSGSIAILGSYIFKLGYVPVAYWVSVTCIHPFLHSQIDVPVLDYVKKRHEKHHENPSKNFGPYFPFFDIAFGTEA